MICAGNPAGIIAWGSAGVGRAPTVEAVEAAAYRVPTDFPESDGTLEWDSTTIVVACVRAAGVSGLGYTYAHESAAGLIRTLLAPLAIGRAALDVPALWRDMVRAVRNLGRPGLCSTAIAAVDTALWDLKARLLGVPLVRLWGQVRPSIAVYGSGGFTSYPADRLQAQLAAWADSGIRQVKMKIGREPDKDLDRVRTARAAIGEETALFVDANGAYGRKQALAQAERFAGLGVRWFEEPVSSDDLAGLRLLRDRAPAGMDIAAGEYGYDLVYFRRMLEAGAIDVLQADATRCAGFTGFLQAGALCAAFGVPLSAHTAPSLHAHPCCAILDVRHVEYFHDHVRIESMFFDGAAAAENGAIEPDLTRPGLGLSLRESEARPYLI